MNFAIFGLLGNLGFGFACMSMAWHTYRAGHGADTKWSTCLLFEFANITFYTYLIGTYGPDPFFCVLGLVEIVSWLIVIGYKVRDTLAVHIPDVAAIFEQECTRPQHIEGPCNGLPRPDCPGYENWRTGLDGVRAAE